MELSGIVLDKYGHEALVRAQGSAVNDENIGILVARSINIIQIKPALCGKVQLYSRQSLFPAPYVLELDVDFWPVESSLSACFDELDIQDFQAFSQNIFAVLPVFR